MSSTKILLIEDDGNLGYILQENLELQGYQAMLCSDGEEGRTTFLREHFDLCLIDVMLPKKDGFSVAREIRTLNKDIPIIFLTAKSLKEDRIEGFKIGCDDYVTKPFSLEELLLRIQAVLKRSGKLPAEDRAHSRFEIGVYEFDAERRILKHQEAERKLTHKETELLRLLCLHRNEVLPREDALNLIWGDESVFNARSMDVYITKLRKYLSGDDRVAVVNVHGKGFKLQIC